MFEEKRNVEAPYENLLNFSLTEKKRVRIVFLLQFNGRAVRQIRRIFRFIYQPQHFYFIHIDKVNFLLFSIMKK